MADDEIPELPDLVWRCDSCDAERASELGDTIGRGARPCDEEGCDGDMWLCLEGEAP